jgi:hypothetical protein
MESGIISRSIAMMTGIMTRVRIMVITSEVQIV